MKINSELKKLFISILIIMLIFPITIPKPVYAIEVLDTLQDFLDNPGNFLLDALFGMVNFVADAISELLGDLMDVKSAKKTVENPESLTEDDVIRINVDKLNDHALYRAKYTPEEIFSGKAELLSIDFISGKNSEGKEIKGDWSTIRQVVSQWYRVLRMIAILGFLSVLIYTGIKIVISANAKDKAKYKEWIINWFIGVAILFSMHYIMSFIISVTGEITNLLGNACGNVIILVEHGGEEIPWEKVNTDDFYATNLMGFTRTMAGHEDMATKIGYEVIYIALLVYTIKFTFVYLKRMLNMAFLTLIAPIVAFTYPIDKLNDGNAQGFNMWIKEYMFNALLQPMHLLLYYVLVGSAATLAGSNPIYGIATLAFMSQAEKLLKKIFGFDKASGGTVGGMAGSFAAGAIASQMAQNVAKLASKGSKGNGGKGGGSSEKNPALDAPKPTEKDSDMNAFLDDAPPEGADGSDNADQGTSIGNEREDERQNLAAERGRLDELEAEGATSDNWTDEDYQAYQELEAEQQEKENRFAQQESNQEPTNNNSGESSPTLDPIHQVAEKNEQGRLANWGKALGRGAGAVGKRMLRPIWDLDRSGKYNGKRYLRRLGKGAKFVAKAGLGFGLGVTAAAVQAGISITDGKYNPMEGMAALTAGFAGGGAIVDKIGSGIGSLGSTFMEGATAGNKEAMMKRAQSRFEEREDVLAFNKKQYPGEEKARMEREKTNYLPKGVTDLKDMKSCMKYADKLVGNTEGLDKKQIEEKRKNADAKAAATLDFRNRLKEQGQLAAVYDDSKREKYIQTMVNKASDADKATTRKKYENAFKSIAAYDAANA